MVAMPVGAAGFSPRLCSPALSQLPQLVGQDTSKTLSRMLSELQGQVERVTYTSEESGFTIARVKVTGRRQLVTIIGNLLVPAPGETLRMRGQWVNHPRYGEQFQVAELERQAPASVYGIQKYLSSGLIKGIGPIMAERIVNKFGEKTLDVIEQNVERLGQVEGIGKKRISLIQSAWKEHQEIREVMLFLQGHGISSAYASKIFKHYGGDSIQVVKDNPYRLAADIFGIGFVTADGIAEKLGFSKDSALRAQAGILYVLSRQADEGHVCYPYEPLFEKCQEVLQLSREIVVEALGEIATAQKIVIEVRNDNAERFTQDERQVYLSQLYLCERESAQRLKMLSLAPKSIRRIDADKATQWLQEQFPIPLAREQVAAVRRAVEDKVLVITGGPGTGKTTIVKAVLTIFSKLQVRILLAAPTGRAAKRLGEVAGLGARTIHRMLEYSPQKGGFRRNEKSPLPCDLLIVDEVSMIDIVLMHHLMKAVPTGATLILVGDVNQLPSVGPGSVLQDIIDSGAVAVARLNEIFRQARESSIVVNAHKINAGQMPSLKVSGSELDDFYFIEQEDPQEVLRIIVELASERIPRRFGVDPVDDIQVITPMHKGIVGSANLNLELQEMLNPGEDRITRTGKKFRINDKVMQICNNYEKEVFNGDIGRITRIDPEFRELTICFDGRNVPYDYNDLDEIVLAYAVSVHKSQGSEYPAVILPLLTQHYVLLQRNLIYTAVTRAKNLVVVVGTKKALTIGIKNDKTQRRYSSLQYRLA